MLAQGFKKVLSLGFGGILFLFIAVYAFFHTKSLIFGVKIEVQGIENGASYTSPIISISGQAKKAAIFTLNGREIFIDKDGDWQDELLLSLGYNIISFEAKDKFGNDVKKDYQLYLKES